MSSLLLALDSGSQSSRALLFDSAGSILGKGQRAHQPFAATADGAVEQDPRDIRACLFGSVRDCLEDWGGARDDIVALALTTQRDTRLLVDEAGEPLTALESWLDRRLARLADDPSPTVRGVLGVLGERSLVPRLLMRGVVRRWWVERPQLLEKAHKLLSIESWLAHQLTGRMATAPSGVVGSLPFDQGKRDWDRGRLMMRLHRWRPEWMCDVVESGTPLGYLTAVAAAELGLPPGLPVIACGGDKQAEVVGSGSRPSAPQLQVSLGTASSIAVPWPRAAAHPLFKWITMCSAEPASWHLEFMVFRGMWTARWFAEQFAKDLAQPAREQGRPVEALLCDEAATAPPGSAGLVTWPRWSPSLANADEVGVVFGLREEHTRAHVFRSLLEGIAFDLRRGKGILQGATGRRFEAVHVGGGGSRSDLVVQILADVLGLPVMRPESAELSARGAAICAAVGAGLHPDFDAAVRAMVPPAQRIEPNPETASAYDSLYRGVYEPGLKEQRSLLRALRQWRLG